ncbi:TetR/AcrR family transcriptional regulator [Rhodobacteraceae bacterium F11138]|nr:TetR/AcrR family transcriptional regulator [Rhodobacteraceae bacterium F11138]
MGLREKNKRIKREALTQAARELFEEQGYDDTQMEEIAARAGVSTATAYNYFETKANVMTAIALRHLRSALPARRALLDALPPEPVDGIIAYERLLAQQTLATLGKRGWRVLLRAAYDSPPTNLTRAGRLFGWSIALHYRKLLETYRDAGRLHPDTDIALTTELITMIGTDYFARMVMDDDMTVDRLIEMIPAYARVILAAWLMPAPSCGE